MHFSFTTRHEYERFAEALNITQRQAQRLVKAGDPRVRDLERSQETELASILEREHAERGDEIDWDSLARELASQQS